MAKIEPVSIGIEAETCVGYLPLRVGLIDRPVGAGHRKDGRVGRCCGQIKIDRLAGQSDGRCRCLEHEIRRLNGHDALQMDFQQAGTADTQGLICRIDVHDGLVDRAIVDPGDGMRRHGSAGRSQRQECECAERRQIDLI